MSSSANGLHAGDGNLKNRKPTIEGLTLKEGINGKK